METIKPRTPKQQKIYDTIAEVGGSATVAYVMEKTGIKLKSVRQIMSRIRGIVEVWQVVDDQITNKAKNEQRSINRTIINTIEENEYLKLEIERLKNDLGTAHEAIRRQNKHLRDMEIKCNDLTIRTIKAEEMAQGADIDRFYRTMAWEDLRIEANKDRRERESEKANQTVMLLMQKAAQK